MTKLYVVTGQSESGDDYFFGVYDEKPTQAHLFALAEERDEILEDEDGSGEFTCYIHFNVDEVTEISQLPEPDTRNIERI